MFERDHIHSPYQVQCRRTTSPKQETGKNQTEKNITHFKATIKNLPECVIFQAFIGSQKLKIIRASATHCLAKTFTRLMIFYDKRTNGNIVMYVLLIYEFLQLRHRVKNTCVLAKRTSFMGHGN